MRAAVSARGLEARIGVNTGEVVAGAEGETLVTGDAVNVAARLEQAAPAGETLIGAETRLLVRDAVRVEPVELALKGKAQPVEAYRLVEVLEGAAGIARWLESPLVGRERERERLWRDFEDAMNDRTCRLFTLLGPAGIGKSRLVADFLERVEDSAEVLRGRCLHYGEGITYWPLVEILAAIEVDPETVVASTPEETRSHFGACWRHAPPSGQVVVIDDLQWAEPVFVDLVEHVADLSRAPIFLLCVARTELLDTRPAGAGSSTPRRSCSSRSAGASARTDRQFARRRAAGRHDTSTYRRCLRGKPLFVEEMVAMVRERGGNAEVVVPPTIQALLQAPRSSARRRANRHRTCGGGGPGVPSRLGCRARTRKSASGA